MKSPEKIQEELGGNTYQFPPKAKAANGEGGDIPDINILRLNRRAPPTLPLCVFGHEWRVWIEGAAEFRLLPARLCRRPFAVFVIGTDRKCPMGARMAGLGRTPEPVVWLCWR